MRSQLAAIALRAVAAVGSKKDLASQLGVTPTQVTRLTKDGKDGEGESSTSIERCLMLARIARESPSAVLRAAGKSEVAVLIESLYGSARPVAPFQPLASEDESCLKVWQQLTRRDRRIVMNLLESLAAEGASQKKRA
jgi:DNA-binding transcriptional regulator YdaS (Cro superfamily)